MLVLAALACGLRFKHGTHLSVPYYYYLTLRLGTSAWLWFDGFRLEITFLNFSRLSSTAVRKNKMQIHFVHVGAPPPRGSWTESCSLNPSLPSSHRLDPWAVWRVQALLLIYLPIVAIIDFREASDWSEVNWEFPCAEQAQIYSLLPCDCLGWQSGKSLHAFVDGVLSICIRVLEERWAKLLHFLIISKRSRRFQFNLTENLLPSPPHGPPPTGLSPLKSEPSTSKSALESTLNRRLSVLTKLQYLCEEGCGAFPEILDVFDGVRDQCTEQQLSLFDSSTLVSTISLTLMKSLRQKSTHCCHSLAPRTAGVPCVGAN